MAIEQEIKQIPAFATGFLQGHRKVPHLEIRTEEPPTILGNDSCCYSEIHAICDALAAPAFISPQSPETSWGYAYDALPRRPFSFAVVNARIIAAC